MTAACGRGAGGRPLAVAPLLAVVALAVTAAAPQPPARRPPSADDGLRGEAGLTRAYAAILDADFTHVDDALARACGPAPIEACHVLEATALWWRIQLDPVSTALDDEFAAAVERAIRSTEAWTIRTPGDAEAWFYLGGAYAARVQWRVLRDEKLSAARDGKRIKEALERALELDPDLDDAYFGIGMYRYYADVAPAAARFLRFLLLLPGGDREEGLAQMLRARTHGRLLQGEADYQLHILYLWYEKDTARALTLLRGLQQDYPRNPLFPIQIAEIEDVYEHDITASLATWRALLARARADRVHLPPLAEVRARFGIAGHLETLAETDEALEQLDEIIARNPEAPYSALALAHLKRGEALDRLNARADAMAAYRLASLSAPDGDALNVRRQATERLRRAPNAEHAAAFRLSLDGWRQLERKEVAAAAASLERALVIAPRDPVARYRYGPRAAGPARAGIGAGAVRARDSRRQALPAPHPRLHLSRGRSAPRTTRPARAGDQRLSDRVDLVRRRRRDPSPRRARARAPRTVGDRSRSSLPSPLPHRFITSSVTARARSPRTRDANAGLRRCNRRSPIGITPTTDRARRA